MEGILYEARFTVQKIVDCSKEYDNIARVEMTNENNEKGVLDVHNKLYEKLLRVGTIAEVSICTELKISEDIHIKASDPVYNPKVSENLKKKIGEIDYCMHGTVFEFQQTGDKITMTVSFGGLLFILTEKPETLVKFKSGQKVYLVCYNTRK
ncbi:RNA_polymerase II subunit Rpb8 [Hexamita inflata]|uniref:DNA-directed RNA polymerases I, II, and III subunit RPABC3 n=1 Tax=Hexamita inflata TaxID=28002 RepID=A0AA86PUC8_9EUKA|nr:RNA polymerase II subunit Rpb8 [Hexamita inflata]